MLGTLSLTFARTSTSWLGSKDLSAARRSYSGIGGAVLSAIPFAFVLAAVSCWNSPGTDYPAAFARRRLREVMDCGGMRRRKSRDHDAAGSNSKI